MDRRHWKFDGFSSSTVVGLVLSAAVRSINTLSFTSIGNQAAPAQRVPAISSGVAAHVACAGRGPDIDLLDLGKIA